MTVEELNKQRVRDFFAILNRGDVPALVAAYAADAHLETMGHTLISGRFTRAQIAAAAGQIYQVFPQGLSFAIDALTAEGERVAVEAHSCGRHVSGALYRNQYHFLFVFRDGQLTLLREYMDTERVTDILCGGQRPPPAQP
jgi:ketosteroid isomerase-like protein